MLLQSHLFVGDISYTSICWTKFNDYIENNIMDHQQQTSSLEDNGDTTDENNERLGDKQKNMSELANVTEEDRQMLRDKMKEMFTKIITDIDRQVLTVSESQCELDSQLDRLISTLDSIKIDEKLTDEISANAKRISSLKSRLTLIHTILSNSSARCSRTLAACGAAVSSLNGPAVANPVQSASNMQQQQ